MTVCDARCWHSVGRPLARSGSNRDASSTVRSTARVDDDLAAELLATLREALSNVARHAKATRVEVEVVVTDQVVLRVVDDGIGPPALDTPRGHGLRNMEARAAHCGGRFELQPRLAQGHCLGVAGPEELTAPRARPGGATRVCPSKRQRRLDDVTCSRSGEDSPLHSPASRW